MPQGFPHVPTEATRVIATTLSAYGVTHEDIARKLEIDADTLVKHYRRELDTGRIEANSRVAERLYQIATQKETGKASVTAMMFWLKTRAGWREVQRHEHVGPDGQSPAVVYVTSGVPRDAKPGSDDPAG